MLTAGVWGQVSWPLIHAPTPSGLRKSADACRTPGSTEVAALALLLYSSEGERVRLCGMVKEQEVLCGIGSSAGLPISLVTCGWSNSFIHAASRRNSSMSVEVKISAGKKVTVSLFPWWVAPPRDFTHNDYQTLALCGTAHPLRPIQLDEPVYNKAEPDTFSWDGSSKHTPETSGKLVLSRVTTCWLEALFSVTASLGSRAEHVWVKDVRN